MAIGIAFALGMTSDLGGASLQGQTAWADGPSWTSAATRKVVFPPAAEGKPRAPAPLALTASDGTGLELVALEARASVVGPLAFTEIKLTFANPHDRRLEGTFKVTLPQRAAISRLAMKLATGWQEGEVVEKQAAREAYEDALHRRQDPALLEQTAGNEVSARVFPIEPRSVKEIIVAYSQELEPGAGYVLPLRGLPQVGRLDVVVGSGGRALVSAHEARITPTADLVVDARELAAPSALRDVDLAVARVRPIADPAPDPLGATILLVDASASRALGWDDEVAAAGRLARLVADGKGALVVAAFDQTVEVVHDGPAESLDDRALARLRARGALGASDLEGALRWAAGAARRTGARRVLLLTDGVPTAGEISGERLVETGKGLRDAGVERLDAVTVGGLRDDSLLRRLATAGLARDGIVIGAADERLPRRLRETTRSGIEVAVPGATWWWPHRLDGVQAGDEALVYAELPARAPLDIRLGGAAAARVEAAPAPRPLLERAIAGAKIASLTEKDASPEARREAVSLSTKYRVLSPLTALVVLETEADYARFKIDRRALADVLTLDATGRMTQIHRLAPPPSSPPPSPPPRVRADALREAAEFGMIGALSPAAPPDPAHVGSSWGSATGEAFGLGGLGLSGAGAGGGGAGHDSAAAAQTPPSAAVGLGHGRAGAASTPAARPMVREASVTVSGRLPPEVIQRIVRQNHGRFRACYQAGLRRAPRLAGRVVTRFWIDRDGSVPLATDHGSDLPDPDVIACAVQAFRAIAFPAPEGGRVTVVYPLVLSLDGEPPPPGGIHPTPRPPEPAAEEPAAAKVEPYTGRFKRVMDRLAASDARGALDEARAWRASEPGDTLALVALGEALERTGDAAGAARAYGSIVDLFPARADLRRFAGDRLARVPGGAGLALAVDTFEEAALQRPDHPSSHRLLAFALLRRGATARAFATLEAALARRYPDGRFAGVERVLREDLGLVAEVWIKAEPARRAEILARLQKAGGTREATPSLRFVLTWETDANDVDFHVRDDRGGHAYFEHPSLPSGGELYADVTTGYGPECFTVRAPPDARPIYRLEAHYYARGPMGYGMGAVQVVEHDGRGGIKLEERPFVIMADQASVDLGTLRRTL